MKTVTMFKEQHKLVIYDPHGVIATDEECIVCLLDEGRHLVVKKTEAARWLDVTSVVASRKRKSASKPRASHTTSISKANLDTAGDEALVVLPKSRRRGGGINPDVDPLLGNAAKVLLAFQPRKGPPHRDGLFSPEIAHLGYIMKSSVYSACISLTEGGYLECARLALTEVHALADPPHIFPQAAGRPQLYYKLTGKGHAALVKLLKA